MARVISLFFLSMALMLSCSQEKEAEATFSFNLKQLSDKDYPDNPDIGFRSGDYGELDLKFGQVVKSDTGFDLIVVSNSGADTIAFHSLVIEEFIPTIPKYVQGKEYLEHISLINQEWNRNQVKFSKGQFYTTYERIVRADIARNCLNSYLWEMILYSEEDGKALPYDHVWFNFPGELYRELFEEKNGVPFSNYRKPLENWIDPESKFIDLNSFRSVEMELEVSFSDHSDKMYPVSGERLRKLKEIISPSEFQTMRELQSDSTSFATFSPPGIYDRTDPRLTELGRIFKLDSAFVNRIKSRNNDQALIEIGMIFSDKADRTKTKLILGGLDPDLFPSLKEDEANMGWKTSMGIGNHSFYESYDEQRNKKTLSSPYYGLLLDESDKWLDSHKVGIDGPLIHLDAHDKQKLNIWLLSFERHALVGHYVIKLQDSLNL